MLIDSGSGISDVGGRHAFLGKTALPRHREHARAGLHGLTSGATSVTTPAVSLPGVNGASGLT